MKPSRQLPAGLAAYVARFDALSLRERVITFCVLLLVVAALADVLVLSPARTQHQQIKTRLAKLAADLETQRALIKGPGKAASGAGDQTGAARAELTGAIERGRAEQQALDRRLKQTLASAEQMARLPDLMARVLKRHDGLTLVRLATTSPDQDTELLDKLTHIYGPIARDLFASPALGGMAAASSAAVAPAPALAASDVNGTGGANAAALRMVGVDLSVLGSYPDLARYLAELEQALPGLRWGELKLHADPGTDPHSTLTVRVYLLGAAS